MRVKPVPVRNSSMQPLPPSKPFLLVTFSPARWDPQSVLPSRLLTCQSKLHTTECLMQARGQYADFFTAKETGSSVFYLGETDLIKQKFWEPWDFGSNVLGPKPWQISPKNSTGKWLCSSYRPSRLAASTCRAWFDFSTACLLQSQNISLSEPKPSWNSSGSFPECFQQMSCFIQLTYCELLRCSKIRATWERKLTWQIVRT